MNCLMDELEQAYHEHVSLMLKMAYLSLGDRQLAEEVVQDVFVSMMQYQEKFCAHNNKKALLIMSLKNRIRNEYSKQNRQKELLEQMKHFYQPIASESFAPRDYLQLLQTYLKEQDAKLLYDYYIVGKSMDTLCNELDITPSGVKMRLHRTKNRLTKNMKQHT